MHINKTTGEAKEIVDMNPKELEDAYTEIQSQIKHLTREKEEIMACVIQKAGSEDHMITAQLKGGIYGFKKTITRRMKIDLDVMLQNEELDDLKYLGLLKIDTTKAKEICKEEPNSPIAQSIKKAEKVDKQIEIWKLGKI